MTAGREVHSFFTAPGMRVPRWNRSAMYYSHGMRGVDRDARSSFYFSDTTPGKAPPLRIQGARSTVDGRRVQSSLALATTREDVREMTCMTLRGIYSPSAKKSVESLPFRPAMARAKQVPGRYFPKAIMSDDQKAALASVRPVKADVFVKRARFPPIKGLEFMKNSFSLQTPTNKPANVQTPSYNKKIAKTRKSRRAFPEFQTEVFAISFQGDTRGAYDPNSELHSDYYSITRLNINSAKDAHIHTGKNQVRVPTSDIGDFRIVLRGQRKLLHGRIGDDEQEQLSSSRTVKDQQDLDLSARSKKNSEEFPLTSPDHSNHTPSLVP